VSFMVDEFIHELFLVFTYAVEWIIMNKIDYKQLQPLSCCDFFNQTWLSSQRFLVCRATAPET
jgi:hypothetical protein